MRPGVTVQVHDRSAVCTLALARHLGHPVPPVLEQEVAWATGGGSFDRRVFFVRLLGFIQPTAVRRISYAESQAFERIHEDSYRRLGFDVVDVPAGTVAERAATIGAHIRSWACPPALACSPASGRSTPSSDPWREGSASARPPCANGNALAWSSRAATRRRATGSTAQPTYETPYWPTSSDGAAICRGRSPC